MVHAQAFAWRGFDVMLGNRAGRWLSLALLIAVALLVSGCSSRELETGETEKSANEMIAVLADAGISATKSKQGDDKWSVSVADGDFAKAVNTLNANGLPRESFESACTVFKKEGMTSSPAEERARENCAKSQELSQTISEMEGVLAARVHLAIPQPDPLSREASPASASVYVKYRTGMEMNSKQAAIKSIVTNGVEGMSFDRVSVYLEPAQSLPIAKKGGDGVPTGDIIRILLGIVAVALLALAGRAWLRGRKSRAIAPVER